MNAKLKVQNPDEIKFTLIISMSLKDWKEVKDKTSQSWPASQIHNAITDMVDQAEQSFYPKQEVEK